MHVLHFITSSLLMISVLLSSTGVRISQHWCGDQLVGSSLFGEAQACSHYNASEKPACPFHGQMETKKNCCDQRETIIAGNDYDFVVQGMEFLKAPLLLVVQLFFERTIQLPDHALAAAKYHNHSPPLIGTDVLVRVQSFLL